MIHNPSAFFIEAARNIAHAICRDAVWKGNACNWIGLTNEDHFGTPKPYAHALSANFYDGTAGIAFFLSQVLQTGNDEVIRKTAEGALEQVIQTELNNNAVALHGKLGFHTGYPGQAWVLLQAAEILGKKHYQKAALELVEKTMAIPMQDFGMDIIDGAASAVPALLYIYKKHPSPQLKDFIISMGKFIISKSEGWKETLTWNTMPGNSSQPLTGFAHGTAGMATALVELLGFTGDDAYANLARKAFAYEGQCFVPEQQNWPDFRGDDNVSKDHAVPQEPVCAMAWCHGAPGIALSRLRAYEITGDEKYKAEATTAVTTTLSHLKIEMLGNYSLCHGLFGNAEVLLNAARILQNTALRKAAEQTAFDAITKYTQQHRALPTGVNAQGDTPDFMLGSSGMGYFLLRLTDEILFPSALLIIP